jgi:hypothetical protein
MLFQRKPCTVEGVQWTGDNLAEVQEFTGEMLFDTLEAEDATDNPDFTAELWVAANGIWIGIETGEWILVDAVGYYPCKDAIMQKNWERVDG